MQNYETQKQDDGRKDLLDEIIYRRYLVNKDRVRDAMEKITVPEYLLLHELKENRTGRGRIYLTELAQQMEIPTSAASKMVRELKDRGAVKWSHDGAGEEGTYVELTESGRSLICSQEEVLGRYLGRVVERFGADRIVELLKMMKELEQVLKSEYEVLEAEKAADRKEGGHA